jgi:uncharacterized protein DUF5666
MPRLRSAPTIALLALFALATPSFISAQTQPDAQAPPRGERGPGGGRRGGGMGGGGMMMGGGNAGQITAISGDTITVKTVMGPEVTLRTSADTRLFGRDRTPIALKDLKVGDYIGAGGGGPPEDGVVQARFIGVLDDAAVKRIQDFKANLGKTVIAGEVKAINDARLTIARPDGQTQEIELDEGTSLRRGREESITLADIKPGDRVFGDGAVKNGLFVPTELRVMSPGMRRQQRGQEGAPANAPSSPPSPPK